MTDTITLPRAAVAGALHALDLSQGLLESARSIHHITVLEEYKSLRAALAQQAEQVPTDWFEMVTVNLVREGVNKHKARELAVHFHSLAAAPKGVV